MGEEGGGAEEEILLLVSSRVPMNSSCSTRCELLFLWLIQKRALMFLTSSAMKDQCYKRMTPI